MRQPKSATVVLPAYRVADAVATVVRDLAVAAYALRSRGLHLEVLLLHDGEDVAAVATRTAAELDLPLTTAPGPASGPGEAYLVGFRQVVAEGTAVVTGATRVEDEPLSEHGSSWVLMQDPEGNEFCIG